MNKHFKQAVAAFLSGSMLLSGAAAGFPYLEASAADCVIDTSTTFQTIKGFGGINLREWTGYDLSDAEVQRAFGNGANELGMSILRIYVNDNSNQWNLAIPVAKKAQSLGATVFATPWNPPASMRSNGNGQPRGGKYVLNNGAEPQYAKHLNDFIKYCEGQGVNLYSISVQNEPDWSGEWTYWSPDRAANFIANYGKSVTNGTKAKLMSPESFSYSKDYYNAILNNSKAMANCDLFGTHFYGTQRNAMDFPALEKCGKDIWMTEVYCPDSKVSCEAYPQSLDQSENIHNGLVVGNMNAYVVWYIKRSYGPLNEQGNISKRGYCLAQYSKWVRPGDVRIAATEQPASNILVSAFKNDQNQVTVVAINKGSGAVNQNFSMGSGEKISGVDAYRTSANENIASVSVSSATESGFTASLPAKSVTTFVVSTGEAEPDPNGYYFHYTFENSTEGFTGRGGASVASSSADKYDGSKCLAVTDRSANWNGASHSLNSTFKAGESYSFSAVVKQNSSAAEKMHLSIQYTGSDGETHYDKIDTQIVPKGEWTQLANTSYTIPTGASNIQIYIETDGDDGSTCDFYIDEVIGAPKGTVIDGPHPDVSDLPVKVEIKLGDINGNGKISAADLSLAKMAAAGKLTNNDQKKASDIDGSGTVDKTDLEWFVKYLTGQTKEFPERVTPAEPEKKDMRLISEYTPIVQKQIVEYDAQGDRGQKAGVDYGTLQRKEYYSSVAKKNKPYYILLPAGYSESKKYPVLYVMHGYYEKEDRMILNGNNKMYTQNLIGNAIAAGEAKEMIVVFPYVFTSQRLDACTGMNDENNKAYDDFEFDLIQCLMPHIESTYSVATGKANTALTGFSMGGRESLNIGTKHSDIFGYVGSICAAPGATPNFKWNNEADAPSLILMTAGSNDQTVGTIPSGYHNNATSANCPHIWHYINGGYHGDNSIHAHIYNFIRVIFKA